MKKNYPFMFIGQGLTPINFDLVEDYLVTILFYEIPEKSNLQKIKKILSDISKETEIQSHIISLYKYFSDKEKKSFNGKSAIKNWDIFQKSLEDILISIHKVQPIALVVSKLANSFKSTKYGSWHLWTVLDQGPDILWPLIYSYWNSKPPKRKIDDKINYTKLPQKNQKDQFHPLDEVYGENWDDQDSGNGIKAQMIMELGAAVKYWEYESGQLPQKIQNQLLKKLTPEQKKFVKSMKKFYPVWI